MDAELVRAVAVSGGLILLLFLVAFANSRLEPAAGAIVPTALPASVAAPNSF